MNAIQGTVRRVAARWQAEGGYGQVCTLAVPLILSTGAWTIQHFVDRMFLVWYSAEAIAAAMPAGLLNFTVMCVFIGTAHYVGTFTAQYYGARRYHRIGPALWQGLYVSALGGIVLACLAPCARSIFTLVGHDPVLRELEATYFRILCLGAAPAIASSALGGFFSGLGRPWPVVWVSVTATAVNLVLDYALIFGSWGLPEMGIVGAAVATVASGVCSFVMYMALVSTTRHDHAYHTLKGWRPERQLLFRLLRFGFPSGVHMFLEMAGFSLFLLLVGRLGVTELAATTIALNINNLAFMPMLGCGFAVSVLVGQNIGRGRPDLAQKSTYSAFHLTFLYMATVAAAYVLVPGLFIAPFASGTDPERFFDIFRLTVVLLRFVAVYSLFDTLNIVFSSAVKGAGDTRYVMAMLAVISAFVMVIPTFAAVVVFGYGLMAAWICASAYVIVLGFAFYGRFLGGRWKTMRVIESRPDRSVS